MSTLTNAQRESAQAALDIMHALNADGRAGEVMPPRIASHDEYGYVLYVGATAAPSDPLADCECGVPHVGYIAIRPDGLGSPLTFSGTVEEALIAVAMMGLTPYDEAREVQPNDWPDA